MSHGGRERLTEEQERLRREIDRREKRRLRARSEQRNPWFGLRMFGMVGWSVAMPTLIGLALGRFVDARTGGANGGGLSWTLTLLAAGVVVGCINAWVWVSREGQVDRPDRDPADDEGGNVSV